MKVAVDVGQLTIGMYVCELDCPWRDTPFLFQGFEIRSQDEIDMLRKYCRTVFILRDENGREVAIHRPPRVDAYLPVDPAARYRSLGVVKEVYKLNNHPSAHSAYEDVTSVQEEVAKVRDTFIEAKLLVQEILHDTKLGRSLSLAAARKVVGSLTESVLRNPDALMCFAQLKRKDEYTALHSLRVCILALTFGRQLGMPRDQLEALGIGALLHDIGMIKVPDEILAKPGALTPQEYALVQQHVVWGAEILSGHRQIPGAALEVVSSHHERYNGSGYLQGLSGDAIGDFGMIGAIVDHYDAITSDRAYSNGVSAHSVLMRMYEWRNTLFKAALVEKFIQCLGIYPIGSVVELNTGDTGVVAAINRRQRLKPHVMLVYRADRRPHEDMPIANLSTLRTPEDRPVEIEHVLEPAAAGIDPAYYLRMAVSF